MNTPNKQILIEILNKNYLNSKKLIETSLNNKIKVLFEYSKTQGVIGAGTQSQNPNLNMPVPGQKTQNDNEKNLSISGIIDDRSWMSNFKGKSVNQSTGAPRTRRGYSYDDEGNVVITQKSAKSHYSKPLFPSFKSNWWWLVPGAQIPKLIDLLPADNQYDWYNPIDVAKRIHRAVGIRTGDTQTTKRYTIPDYQPRTTSSGDENQKNQDMGPISSNGTITGWRQRGSQKTIYADNVKINEEIVNRKNKGTMSKTEIGSRDRLAKKVKAEPIKGNDTKKNAQYRLATYIILKNRKGDK